MKHALKCITGQKSSSATVVDGKLILSFPEALTPVVWQMDLSEAKSSALEVREGAEGKKFTLTLKTAKGETVDIAPFAQRDQALGGLMAAAKALENAHGQIRPAGVAVTHTAPGPQGKGKWGKVLLAIGALIILFMIWVNIAPRTPGGQFASLRTTATAPTSAVDEPGVPVSADDFLKNR